MFPADRPDGAPKVAYLVKRYPRYSETFVVNEILAHEAAGLAVEIFSLYPCIDSHFQDAISRVRAPVRHILAENVKGTEFWSAAEDCARVIPDVWPKLSAGKGEEAKVVFQALRVAAAARRGGITHLHAHFATSATSVARLASWFAGVPFTFTAHAKDIFHESVDPADLRSKLCAAAACVTVSDFNLSHLRHEFGDAASRVTRIYNGLDLAGLHYADPADRPPLVLGVGRLVEKKGFADLISACAILSARRMPFICKIIGEGECGSDLREQIKAMELRGVVELVGPMPQRQVFEVMRQAAVFAAPCIVGKDQNRDGLPTVLLEAMALGTPCVATDVTGIPEVVRHQETGLLARQNDPRSLADAIERMLMERTTRVKLARQARALIEDQFDIQQNSAALREVFASAGGVRESTLASSAAEVA